MMKWTLFLAVCCLLCSSCEKAKEIATKAQSAVETRIEEVKADFSGSAPDVPPVADTDLLSLVDQTPDGYAFRKDLPFPSRLKVKVAENSRFSGRHFKATLLGSAAGTLKGEFQSQRELELRGGEVTVVYQESIFIPELGSQAGGIPGVRKTLRPGGRMDFVRKGKNWIPSEKAKDLTVMARFAGKDTDAELSSDCIMPRPFWFGKGRLKEGDEVVLTGLHLGMIGLPGEKGEIRMTFTGTEPVDGHPCGVFTVSGTVDQVGDSWVGESGGNIQVTIESGKLWLSLLHPVVLKEELETVITSRSGAGKKLSSHVQGSASIRIRREWIVQDS